MEHLVTACNEVVNFVNINTNEIRYKIYDKEAEHGTVTHLKVSGNMLAVGYSSGTIIVYDLEIGEEKEFTEIHRF